MSKCKKCNKEFISTYYYLDNWSHDYCSETCYNIAKEPVEKEMEEFLNKLNKEEINKLLDFTDYWEQLFYAKMMEKI